MKFEIRDCNLSEFLKSLRQVEGTELKINEATGEMSLIDVRRPFSAQAYADGERNTGDNNREWNTHLHWNHQKFGHKIFSIIKRKDKTYPENDQFERHKRNRIPVNNYFAEFYYYPNGSKREVVGCVDLKWNDNGEMTASGAHPLFLMEQTVMETIREGKDTLVLHSINEVLRMCIKDRLHQICAYKGSIPNPSLLAESIKYAFKFSEVNLGNKENFQMKIKNRIVFINRADTDDGLWGFKWGRNHSGNFSDCLNSDEGMNLESLERVLKHFDNGEDGIVLGESSEEGGRKGNITILNKELQMLRKSDSDKLYDANYEDIMYGKAPGTENSVYSIYDSPAKFFARVKSFLTSDGCQGQDFMLKKLDNEGKPVFDIHKTYLSNNVEKLNRKDWNTKTVRRTKNKMAMSQMFWNNKVLSL